jgi:ATP-dependent Lon protease
MGGLRDSSHFVGFDYTYSGSRYGIILQTLMETRVMNPIIFMDELDKISMTNEGIEIQNLLIHLTDPIQNNTFQDKYFAGIHIDISKAVFIFAFNDIENIHPILKDRLHIVKVPEPTFDEKVIICKNYLLSEICNNIGINKDDIHMSDDVIRNLIKKYCNKDKGVRNLKRKLESILLKINLARYIDKGHYSLLNKIEFPYTINDDIVDLLLKNDKNENDIPDHVMNMFL